MSFRFREVYVLEIDGSYDDIVVGVNKYTTLHRGKPHDTYRWLAMRGGCMGGHSIVGEVLEERGKDMLLKRLDELNDVKERTYHFIPLTLEYWQKLGAMGAVSKEKVEAFDDTATLKSTLLADLLDDDWAEAVESGT